MSIFLDRFDSVPLLDDKFSYDFSTWVSNMVDIYNENIEDIQNGFNNLQAQPLTTAEINLLFPNVPNGTFWYCTDAVPPNIVLKIDDALVQLVTAPFP